MAKKIEMADKSPNHKEEFIKILESIKPSKNAYEVFADWLVLAAAGFYAWKKDKLVEKEYKEIAKNYSKEDLDKHAQLLAITVEALEEDDEQDFLGEIFIDGEFRNKKKAQVFTPFHVSKMMSKMIIGSDNLPKNDVLKIYDPCCGSGVMLIAAISVLRDYGFNYQHNAFFIATDIDARCARMTYIQLSLLGVPAVIICGNTLTKETFWERETIGYIMSGMNFKLRNSEKKKEQKNFKTGEKRKTQRTKKTNKSDLLNKSEEPKVINPSDDGVQEELF